MEAALCVTELPSDLFTNESQRLMIEQILGSFGGIVRFIWLRSFRRLIAVYQDSSLVNDVKNYFHSIGGLPLADENKFARVYSIQIPITDSVEPSSLHPPENDRMFLISPPASPPFGWQQIKEQPPVISLHSPLTSDDSDSHSDADLNAGIHTSIQKQLVGCSAIAIARGGSADSLADMMEFNYSITSEAPEQKSMSQGICGDFPAALVLPRIIINDWDRAQRKLQSGTATDHNSGDIIDEEFNSEMLQSSITFKCRQIPKTRMPFT
jgi:hypothetical protein